AMKKMIVWCMMIGLLTATPAWAQRPVSDAALVAMPRFLDEPRDQSLFTTQAQFTASGGVYLLHQLYNSDGAFTIATTAGKSARTVRFTHGMDAAPVVWRGAVADDGWGVRGRWFQLDADSRQSYTTLPGETVRGLTTLTTGQPALAGTVAANGTLAIRAADL